MYVYVYSHDACQNENKIDENARETMTKLIKQRKKWRLVGRRARVGGGARMQTDRSKNRCQTHTHTYTHNL